MPVLPNPIEEVQLALDNANGAPPLRQVAASATTTCILVCDVTRPVPNEILLGAHSQDSDFSRNKPPRHFDPGCYGPSQTERGL